MPSVDGQNSATLVGDMKPNTGYRTGVATAHPPDSGLLASHTMATRAIRVAYSQLKPLVPYQAIPLVGYCYHQSLLAAINQLLLLLTLISHC